MSETDRNELNRYIELTTWIRELSAPQLDEYEDAEDYRRKLLRNFTRIGELARLNNEILDKYYLPLIENEEALSGHTIETMRSFADALLDAYSLENLDVPMMFMQAEKLLKDAEKQDDLPMLIHALDDMVAAAYTMKYVTQRLSPYFTISDHYRDTGAKAALRLLDYIKPELFETLPDDECREIVLINARYIITMFDRKGKQGNEALNAADFQMLKDALSLADEPFYREQAPHYNWRYHIFRTLEYITNLAEMNNSRGFGKEQLAEIGLSTKRMEALWASDEAYFSEFCTPEVLRLYLDRIAYLTDEIDEKTYKERLRGLFEKRDANDFSMRSNMLNLALPIEYILLLDGTVTDEEDIDFLRTFYKKLPSYVYHMPKKGALSFTLSYLSDILHHFISLPGGMDFETLCMQLIASLHPPTYVHTLSVADITERIVRKLIEVSPELFTDMEGYRTKEDVRNAKEELAGFAYHAALMHDIGKIFIVETIITYGRRLFNEEFRLITTHPTVGAFLLELYPETRPYANVARGHHRFFDNSAGYPEGFDYNSVPERAIIAAVAVADCMDASTDAIGRSYKSGKTLNDFLQELSEGKGTRYAPYVSELFEDEAFCAEIRTLIAGCRNQNYKKAYHILEGL